MPYLQLSIPATDGPEVSKYYMAHIIWPILFGQEMRQRLEESGDGSVDGEVGPMWIPIYTVSGHLAQF